MRCDDAYLQQGKAEYRIRNVERKEAQPTLMELDEIYISNKVRVRLIVCAFFFVKFYGKRQHSGFILGITRRGKQKAGFLLVVGRKCAVALSLSS